ncbi:HAD-IA family hydrolase [Candidatus Woesearchaeota archaeon]|nr:HAD-IA family hydrolase [Candidatus Woesearchaeota archaeon]
MFSHEAGTTKFDGDGIFMESLEQTGEKPEKVVFIDDNFKHVEKARKLGMNVIYFKNPKQLEESLREFT